MVIIHIFDIDLVMVTPLNIVDIYSILSLSAGIEYMSFFAALFPVTEQNSLNVGRNVTLGITLVTKLGRSNNIPSDCAKFCKGARFHLDGVKCGCFQKYERLGLRDDSQPRSGVVLDGIVFSEVETHETDSNRFPILLALYKKKCIQNEIHCHTSYCSRIEGIDQSIFTVGSYNKLPVIVARVS
ncbi:hypothetical protein BDB01DRAFT_900794 [Pilobolus umbonatus]|nr:hypothetical protein BDB01DRAFT_900794 [Pilobolus umbonatus]